MKFSKTDIYKRYLSESSSRYNKNIYLSNSNYEIQHHKITNIHCENEEENNKNQELINLLRNSYKKNKKKKSNLKNITISDEEDDFDEKISPKKHKKMKLKEENDENYGGENGENNTTTNSEIINDGYLIYRYCSNQIELEGNWYVANDPSWKERISYLFSKNEKGNEIMYDLYPEMIEKKYHNVEKMTCLGALENEKLMCDNIIDYKIKKVKIMKFLMIVVQFIKIKN